MVLTQVGCIWHLRIRLGSAIEQQHECSLETDDLARALFRAEQVYADFRRSIGQKVDDRPMCWQCVHWEPVRAACYFGWPEARQTGGRFAAQCSVFKACQTQK